ncbi:MAG: lantibiotic immunity ABC transporter MutE/EpiE family permease subunit [Clostridia bacterium]
MHHFLQSEWLKQKHSFNLILPWIAPLFSILLALMLMGGRYLQEGAYNWWYTMLLPSCCTLLSAFMVAKERKKNRHGLFGIVVQKDRLWLVQIVLCSLLLFASCMLFFVGVTLGGLLFEQTINIGASFFASVLLFVTFAWQIPLWMFATEKIGIFASILLSLLCNFGVAVVCAVKSIWWIPFSIPARLMCAVIGVLPNGLSAEAGSEITNPAVILPGVLIAAALLLVLTVATTRWFRKQEA